MRVVDAAQMRSLDAYVMRRLGETELMRRAGIGIAEVLRSRASGGHVVGFAGPGDNGGDVFALCAELAGSARCTILAHDAPRLSPARRAAEEHARATGVQMLPFPTSRAAVQSMLVDATLLLDGMLGIGARPDTTAFAEVIAAINETALPVCAVDIPTGIDATDGTVSAAGAVRAAITCTLGRPKTGLFSETARAYIGELWLIDIGTTDADIDAVIAEAAERRYTVLTPRAFIDALPQRAPLVDKRSAGAPLLVAGSSAFPGAAVLSARGAARAGAGYVTVVTPQHAVSVLQSHLLEQVVVGLETSDAASAIACILQSAQRAQALAIGPGIDREPQMGAILRGVLEQTTLPVVIDAGALEHLADHLHLLRDRACVITPHEGEFARLTRTEPGSPQTRRARLRAFVDRTGITTLLKGNVTLIDDGRTMYFNPTGTPALATAGTGDVLTGMIATLLAQGCSPLHAASLAAYWHGLAGQVAARRRRVGVIAGDLPDLLARALPRSDAPSLNGALRLW